MASEPLRTQHVVPRNIENRFTTPASQQSTDRRSLFMIQSLPHELLAIVLHMSLLPLDLDGHTFWSPDPCPKYLASLHSLRIVCAAWRDLVDGTPYLWNVVCAALPVAVNSALLAKSGQSHVVVHASEEAPTLDEFMGLVIRHRSRWGTIALQLPNRDIGSVARYLADPAPQVQKITLSLGLENAPWTGLGLNLLGGLVQNIRDLDIYATPIQWLSNAFAGLRSLKLTFIETRTGGGLPAQSIVDILACSPTLETLELFGTEVIPTPIDTGSPRTHLPLLTSLRLQLVSAMGADCILRRITVEPKIMTRLEIRLNPDEADFDASRFLSETLAPFASAYQQLNKRCNGSKLALDQIGKFIWTGDYEERYFFTLNLGIEVPSGISWLEQAVGVEGPGVLLPLYLDGLTTEGAAQAFSALQGPGVVTEISVYSGSSRPGLDMMLDAISGRAGPHSDLTTSPAFPALHTITLFNWAWNLEKFEKALKGRFFNRTAMEPPLPDLLIKILYPTSLGSKAQQEFRASAPLRRSER
ncbi:hypothetical protein FS837_003315 [Tulasnella sp. UAMH 9824]|nr:hypothetical protein FS837_003315 [Tulasnella sp. UAMH 9824]